MLVILALSPKTMAPLIVSALANSVLGAILNGIGTVLQDIYAFGANYSVINPRDLVTLLLAEGIFALNAFIIKVVFFRKGSQHAHLMVTALPSQADANGNQILCARVENVYGDRPARDCQAKISLEELEDRDTEGFVVDAAKRIVTDKRDAIETELMWKDTHKSDATIRIGRHSDLEVLRYVPERNGIAAHFDIPSENGWEPLSGSVHAVTQNLVVMVSPLYGKEVRATFHLRRIRNGWTF